MIEHPRQNARFHRPLVVGANSQVGTQMLRFLNSRDGAEAALATARKPKAGQVGLDLSLIDSVSRVAALLDPHPLASIYCIGGMTNADDCEDRPELAHQTNGRAPGFLAAYARQRNVPFVYFSSEYVFDGSPDAPGPYPEDAPLNPLSVYGRSKVHGEQSVLDAHPEALVVRTTVVYGPDPREVNYVYKLMQHLSVGTPMRVPEDQVSTPTYNKDLVLAAVGLVEAGCTGIFHVCGPELLGRLQFAQAIAEKLGLNTNLLQGMSTAELGQRAPRPLAAGLSTAKLTTRYPHLRMRTHAEALSHCASELHAFLDRDALTFGRT